ncbi:uncharacterized protein LOC126381331 [Pectinophora gossypiella]|uniref:uncharacterized protein LOC126381331 n=1 Tax=Pectinophora gossypiella TaxID=13191 RepID=UPI00214E1B3A|nr:uncharacterized protein LOC126381331 [Pectinophora gossypiella]
MAPPTAGVTKRRARTFVRTRVVTQPIAADTPPPPPRLNSAGVRLASFPLPMPRLPRAGPAEKRTVTPPQRPPTKPGVRTTPPVALSMPLLDMETTPPRSFASNNPFSPLFESEKTPPRSYAAVLNTNPDSPPHAPPRPSPRTMPTPSPKPVQLQPPLAPASKKIPPIVVDQLPDWPHHFRKLATLPAWKKRRDSPGSPTPPRRNAP